MRKYLFLFLFIRRYIRRKKHGNKNRAFAVSDTVVKDEQKHGQKVSPIVSFHSRPEKGKGQGSKHLLAWF